MNTISITLLSIFLPLVILLSTFIFYILLKWYFWKKYTSYFDDLSNFLDSQPYSETLTAIRTVDIALQKQEKNLTNELTSISNDKIEKKDSKLDEIKTKKNEFANQFLEIEKKINELKDLKENLYNNLSDSRVLSSRPIVKKCDKIKMDLSNLKKNVTEKTMNYINPLNEFESKKIIYDRIIRRVEKSSSQWIKKIDSDNFKINLEKKIFEIQETLKKASDKILVNKEEAFDEFNRFKKMVYELLMFANHFDGFYEILFIKSVETYNKVAEFIKKTSENLGSDFRILNVETFIKTSNEELTDAKDYFYNLNIEETKTKIEKYFNTLLSLTYTINSEINASNFFVQYNSNNLNFFIKEADKKKSYVKEIIEQLIPIDKAFYSNVLEGYLKLEDSYNETKNKYDEYLTQEPMMQSFASKQSSFKRICREIHNFINECNEIEKTINIFYTEGISPSLQFSRLRKIYINSLADIKTFKIKLDINDNELIEKIEKKKNEIDQLIFNFEIINKIDNENLTDKVNSFLSLMIDFVKTVTKKILLIKSFGLIVNQYSYKRINSNIFNMKIKELEEEMFEGKYFESLKKLVLIIKGEGI